MKRILLLAVLLIVSVNVAAADPSNEITATNVLRLMNEYRAQEGLAPLHADVLLDRAAADRMRHMEEESFWSHESPDGLSPFHWLSQRQYHYRAAGENLAYGFETAGLLVQSWMESRGHRANILSANYEDCGIAIIDGSTRGPSTGKSVVVMFGSRMVEQVQVIVHT
ncbi:MAG TPA: CAP domain-containing protein, partial [Thermoanaerobaculia bacterium]|nr:CAP domain-containing protein [Thermoanaerobaculia bacterium]